MITAIHQEKVALKALENFMKNDYLDCLPMYQSFVLQDDGSIEKIRDGFSVFLYSEGLDIKGIMIFSNSRLCMVHFIDESAAKSYDVLKTIKYHKPEVIRGNAFSADLMLRVLVRSLANYQTEEFYIMTQEHETDKILQYAEDRRYKVVVPEEVPFNTLVPFLIDMEKTFGRNPTSITLLKKKFAEKANDKYYCFAWDGVQVVGQGHFEYDLPHHVMIGGIFTDRHHRNQGIGKVVTESLCAHVKSMGKIPALMVALKNEGACHLYDELGFVRQKLQKSHSLKYGTL